MTSKRGIWISPEQYHSILKGDYSSSSSLSIAYAKKGQILDAGAKMIHIGKHTKSTIISKSQGIYLFSAYYTKNPYIRVSF